MLKKLLITLLLLQIQLLSQQDEIIEMLDSPIYSEKTEALIYIEENQLVEYIPYIQDRMGKQPNLILDFSFLKTLKKLNSPLLFDCIESFMEKAYNIQSKTADMYLIFGLLMHFDLNYYNTGFYYIDYFLTKYPNSNDSFIMTALVELGLHRSQYLNYCQSELFRIFMESDYDPGRYSAMIDLQELDYNFDNELLKNKALSDNSYSIRAESFVILLRKNYGSLNHLYKEAVFSEQSESLRYRILNSLLSNFGYPSDLKFVLDYIPLETDDFTKNALLDVAIVEFKPKYFDEPINEFAIIDSLFLYINQMFAYEWIYSTETRDQYLDYRNSLSTYFKNSDTEEVNSKIIEFIDVINNDYDSNINRYAKEYLITYLNQLNSKSGN